MFDISSPNTYIPMTFLTLIAIFVSILHRDAKRHVHETTEDLPYYTEIMHSMDYIERCILEDGRFQYRKNVSSDITYENETYNSLRHAGTLYAMYMYEKLGLEKRYYDERIKASEYFINRYVKKLGKTKYVVISIPKEENLKFPIAKSGAVGVALCALSNLYTDDKIDLKILQGLGDFLLSLQGEDGNFYAYFDLNKKEINKEAQAPYYAGEAVAGLVYLYEVDPQKKWLEAAKKTLTYIAKTGKKMNLDIPFDHWAVLAIEKLFKKNLLTNDEKTLFESYAEQMVIPMLSKQITNINHSYCGAFSDNIMPCSLGTIMEGLASVYFCTSSEDLKKIIYKSLSIGCMFLNKVQVKTGEQAGGLPNSANWVKAGVTPNASVIRIDNVQHVVTAWLKFQNIISLQQKNK
jgi:hypothetical protein